MGFSTKARCCGRVAVRMADLVRITQTLAQSETRCQGKGRGLAEWGTGGLPGCVFAWQSKAVGLDRWGMGDSDAAGRV